MSLPCGVDEFGLTVMEENVVSAGGCTFTVSSDDIKRLINQAGFEVRQRNTRCELLD